MADKQLTTNRDGFTSRWGFILACIGSAVGMGNIWRFPIMVSLWGGMTFLIPYFICVLLIGSTGVIGEFALGRATGAGPIGAFGECTALRGNRKIGEGIGLIPVIGSMALAIGYTVVMGWIFKYTFISITGDMHAMGQDMASIGGHFDVVAVNNVPCIIVAILASFAIMALGVSGGIEKANKIMMPALFLLFVVLGVYIAFLPGSGAGYKYIFTLDPKGLLNPLVWIFAFGQAFMRPWSQAACASGHECGVPSTRMCAKVCVVFSGNGAITAGATAGCPGGSGRPGSPAGGCTAGCSQTLRLTMPVWSRTGIGKRSPKPRTPGSVPK